MSAGENAGGEITAAQMGAYETTYATKRRAIFRWQAIGREHNDPPPLSRPAEMLAWWARRMKQRPPAKLMALAEKTAPVSAGSAAAPQDASTAGAPIDPSANKGRTSAPVDFSKIEGASLASAVKRLEMQLAAHQQALEDAMAKGYDENAIQLRQRNVNVTIDLLRKCESTLDEQRKSRGDLIDIADVQEDWGTLLAGMAAMRERMVQDVMTEIESARDEKGGAMLFTPAQVAAVCQAVRTVRDREDTLLRGAKHWKPTDAAERPAV